MNDARDVTRDGQRVVAVTGGGGGIGAAIAEELGRQGAFVVTMDPLVTLDGSEQLPAPEETTAGRIVASGGSARATSVSVTDAEAVRDLFAELPRLDAVINVAGISRPTSFTKGTEQDWRDVLDVHLNGYVNVLNAALPIMSAAGRGTVLGVTSGSGWRAADAGAYSCAKRAVAALTWELGRHAPDGVTINAISPIAVTRMVTAALGRARATGKPGAATGGLSLGSMPEPEELGPLGAHLAREVRPWLQGQVIFAGGSEVSVIAEPQLLEVVHSVGPSMPELLEAASDIFVAAESTQLSGGGTNPRLTSRIEAVLASGVPTAAVESCAVIAGRADLADEVTAALERRGIAPQLVETAHVSPGFEGAARTLAGLGPVDGVVVVPPGSAPGAGRPAWQGLLDEHAGLVDRIHADASWARACADRAAAQGGTTRLVTLVDATTGGGRSHAQAAAQLARSARPATKDMVSAVAVSVESDAVEDRRAAGDLAAHLIASAGAPGLSGAELVVGAGWVGLRSHPRPTASFAVGAGIPERFDDALREVLR